MSIEISSYGGSTRCGHRLLLAAIVAQALNSAAAAADIPVDPTDPAYADGLAAINAGPETAIYSGQGTAVVQFEDESPYWNGFYDLNADRIIDPDTEARVFGDCEEPAERSSMSAAEKSDFDRRGWIPRGSNCAIAWVMQVKKCFRKCVAPVPTGNHATSVARGIIAVAPDTKIVFIHLKDNNGRAYKDAVEWLLTPSAELAEAGIPYYSDAVRAAYYEDIFDGKSPAEHWNVVATNASMGTFMTSPAADGLTQAVFSEPCELTNPDANGLQQPQKYLHDWWSAHGVADRSLASYEYFDTHSAMLRAAGIVPLFAANNYMWRSNSGEFDPRFVSQNGVAFPACLAETFAVSSISSNYQTLQGQNNRYQYINSLAHPELTDFVAPVGASSFATPLVAGTVAVIRSTNLAPKASIAEVISLLKTSNSLPATVGFSCNPTTRVGGDTFPKGEHPSLDCQASADPYLTPYSLSFLDLGAVVEAARKNSGTYHEQQN